MSKHDNLKSSIQELSATHIRLSEQLDQVCKQEGELLRELSKTGVTHPEMAVAALTSKVQQIQEEVSASLRELESIP